ncbi:MAG: hypothetical protein ACTSU4_06410 [Promethearchaeota archaeon]
MSINRIYKRLLNENKKFITSKDLISFSREFYYDYYNVIRYLLNCNYLLKIFKGIFYVKSEEEIKQNKTKYSLLELVGKALELKGIKNWYFGLYTALILNGVMVKDEKKELYVMSDEIFRAKPINILNHVFKFIKLNYNLTTFGIIDNIIRYSDLEKTILDFIYLAKNKSVADQIIINNMRGYMSTVSEERILHHAQFYPKSNLNIIKKLIEKECVKSIN